MTYFDENKPADCDFTATSQINHATCELPNGSIAISTTPPDEYQYIWSDGSTNNILQNVAA